MRIRQRQRDSQERGDGTDRIDHVAQGCLVEVRAPDVGHELRTDRGIERLAGHSRRAGLRPNVSRVGDQFLGVAIVGDGFVVGRHPLMLVLCRQ